MRESDPDVLGNFFKVTVSEIAVYLGDMLAHELRGSWRYARLPTILAKYGSLCSMVKKRQYEQDGPAS